MPYWYGAESKSGSKIEAVPCRYSGERHGIHPVLQPYRIPGRRVRHEVRYGHRKYGTEYGTGVASRARSTQHGKGFAESLLGHAGGTIGKCGPRRPLGARGPRAGDRMTRGLPGPPSWRRRHPSVAGPHQARWSDACGWDRLRADHREPVGCPSRTTVSRRTTIEPKDHHRTTCPAGPPAHAALSQLFRSHTVRATMRGRWRALRDHRDPKQSKQ